QAEIRVESESGTKEITRLQSTEVSLTRVPGNPLGIVPPKPRTDPPTNIADGKVLLERSTLISIKDSNNCPGKPGCRYKMFPLTFTAGATYVIEMNKIGTASRLDPYLLLHDPDDKKVAEDDDGGGELNARIVYNASQSGAYKVYAT